MVITNANPSTRFIHQTEKYNNKDNKLLNIHCIGNNLYKIIYYDDNKCNEIYKIRNKNN